MPLVNLTIPVPVALVGVLVVVVGVALVRYFLP